MHDPNMLLEMNGVGTCVDVLGKASGCGNNDMGSVLQLHRLLDKPCGGETDIELQMN
jgi:hypothetical protein